MSQKDAQIAAKDTRIIELTNKLLDRSPVATQPGARQAVSAAVQSIAEGAEQGDARLQQALDLLKDNKTAEAAQLLNTLATDKTARAEQASAQAEKDRKDAATAYRNLGAIALLSDPRRGLEAYEKALALDPDDMESLLMAGMLQFIAGNHIQAQTRLERVVTRANTNDQEDNKALALYMLGLIKSQRGDLSGALKSYSDSFAIVERLALSAPDNTDLQLVRSALYEAYGGLHEAQGDLKAALKSYQESLAIRERLVKSDPGNMWGQKSLASSHIEIGRVQSAQGDLKAAQTSYKTASPSLSASRYPPLTMYGGSKSSPYPICPSVMCNRHRAI